MLGLILLCVFMLSVFMLRDAMVSVIAPSVIMLKVVAPQLIHIFVQGADEDHQQDEVDQVEGQGQRKSEDQVLFWRFY